MEAAKETSRISRRDEFNISIGEEGDGNLYSREDVNVSIFSDESQYSANEISGGVCYYQPDGCRDFKEVSQGPMIVETKTIELPMMFDRKNMTIDNSKSNLASTPPQEFISINETEEDLVATLDNLAAKLGEPPRKKSVWDNFDLLVKNKPLAVHIEESDRKSWQIEATILKESEPPNSVYHPNIKTKSLKNNVAKRLRFESPGRPCQVPGKDCANVAICDVATIQEMPGGDTTKGPKRTVKKKIVAKRPESELEWPKRQCQIPDGEKYDYVKKLSNGLGNNVPQNSGSNHDIPNYVDKGDSFVNNNIPMFAQGDVSNYANNNIKSTHYENNMIQLPSGISWSKTREMGTPTKTQFMGTLGNIVTNMNVEFQTNEMDPNSLVKVRSLTGNKLSPQMSMNCCNYCNFKTLQSHLMKIHMDCHIESLQYPHQTVSEQQTGKLSTNNILLPIGNNTMRGPSSVGSNIRQSPKIVNIDLTSETNAVIDLP